ncbi:MAG TPA: hypothetical protein VGO50_14665 [Pyrinomonadaceae bacterium]|jgi:hypothetical protein|nr:hypothetical protein [Pyrinomonadaceae bacterium]
MKTQNKASQAVDTTFVLFFLAVEFGRSITGFDLGTALIATTLLSFIVLPYFLPALGEKPEFSTWLVRRSAIALFAAGVGVLFSRSVGTTFPDAFAYLPMTLLIVTAMTSTILQFYGFLVLNTARK